MVILSQIKPGTINKLKKRKDIKLFYQVETLIFGESVERALFPERIIVGKDKKIKIGKNTVIFYIHLQKILSLLIILRLN